MREFVFGSDTQFNALKLMLQDGQCHVYEDVELPRSCSARHCRIGFEEDCGAYTMLIDLGIRCSKPGLSAEMMQFRSLLKHGEIRFLDFNDMKEFIKGLKILY